jgi:Fe2+ transport system protein FeoA
VEGTFIKADDSFALYEAEAGQRVFISKVGDEASVLEYLGERGLVPGRLLKVREVRALDGVVTVEDEDGQSHSLGESLAASVFVRSTSDEDGG